MPRRPLSWDSSLQVHRWGTCLSTYLRRELFVATKEWIPLQSTILPFADSWLIWRYTWSQVRWSRRWIGKLFTHHHANKIYCTFSPWKGGSLSMHTTRKVKNCGCKGRTLSEKLQKLLGGSSRLPPTPPSFIHTLISSQGGLAFIYLLATCTCIYTCSNQSVGGDAVLRHA